MSTVPGVITRAAAWAASKFYQLDLRGPKVPDGPVLVVANHPNALLDPILIFRTAGRVVRPLAKEPLFRHPLLGPMLRALGGLPVYRRQDDPALMHQNEKTFEHAVAALHAGDAVQIYPEGQSHSEARITPLKTGAARIAFRAEEEADWKLGLKIVPVGLTYTRKTFFRGRAVAVVGEPIDVASFRTAYETDAATAVHDLTDEIARRLEALTLVLTNTEDIALIDTAERMYAREKALVDWRDADGLGERLPRMQAFAHALAWLRANDPERHLRLAHAVKRYRKQAELLGAHDGDVPPRYGATGVAWYVVRELVVLGVGLPISAVALLFWYPPYLLNRMIVTRLNVEETGIATHKLGLAIILFPLTLVFWAGVAGLVAVAVAGAGWVAGVAVAFAVAGVVLVLGIVLYGWSGRWGKVKQDVWLFFGVIGRRRSQDRLAEQRKELVAEFDDIRPRTNLPN